MSLLLYGCGSEPQAPKPTVNPNPHKRIHLKIEVDRRSNVNNVEVFSQWNISNLSCAPTRWLSGSTVQKQVEVREKVVKMNGYFWATVSLDHFVPGKCRWVGNTYNIYFLRDHEVLATTGAGPGNFRGSSTLKLTCIPPPHIPVCDLRTRESFDKSHFSGAFNVELEIIK